MAWIMMTYEEDKPAVLPGLNDLIETHGRLAVGFAYLRAALARRKHPPDLAGALWLSPHLRRDIGLQPDRWDSRLR